MDDNASKARWKIMLSALLLMTTATEPAEAEQAVFGLAIHGGAGTITRSSLSEERESELRTVMGLALDAGYQVLEQGGYSLDAVQAAIVILEDSPLFNAGFGAVYTHSGAHELDASLMDGKTLNAGAVAAVSRVRNPILLARKVMDESPHVMLSGAGADEFATSVGLALVDNTYFDTEFRLRQLKAAQSADTGGAHLQHAPQSSPHKYGTVGAVALDKLGNLAAGTSTGGMTNKRFGRIGDSPVIGAGTYANNESCAVSATGHGEFFIRYTVAHEICVRARYAGLSLDVAARGLIQKELLAAGGSGGVIAIDTGGNVSMPFNTEGMYRAMRMSDGRIDISIYKD